MNHSTRVAHMRGVAVVTQGKLLQAIGRMYPYNALEVLATLQQAAMAELSAAARHEATADRDRRIHNLRAAGKSSSVIRGILLRDGLGTGLDGDSGIELSVRHINRILSEPRP